MSVDYWVYFIHLYALVVCFIALYWKRRANEVRVFRTPVGTVKTWRDPDLGQGGVLELGGELYFEERGQNGGE